MTASAKPAARPQPAEAKDGWDKAHILMSVLIPASIALAGHFISVSVERSQIASAEQLGRAQREAALYDGIVGRLDDISAALYRPQSGGAVGLGDRLQGITQLAMVARA